MTNVLIALDEAPVSLRAARVAVRLFGADSRYFVVNVSELPVPWVGTAGFGAVMPMAVDPRWLDETYDPDDDEDTSELMALAEEAGVPAPEALVRTGNAVVEICSAADDHDVDVIVVGSHDKSALRQLFDPSVAAGVVRTTYRPVLVVSGAPPADRPPTIA